ncbi:MAG: flippase-like domain-containing protein [Anaerolineaceae bacterium]|nr:flippase-like domain-containing protein [Anaerolineaceae bacterium]MBN2676978.1 flippase-like domain-containing protein [Anaerolineaceae bacterium]
MTQNEVIKRKPFRSSLLRWLGTLIALALLIFLLSRQGWTDICQAIQRIPTIHFLIVVGLIFLSRFAVVGRWYVLIRSAEQCLTLGETIRLVFAGLFASNFLPTTIGGDVIRLAGAVRRKKDPAVITASLLADRLVGMIGMASLLPIGLPYLLAGRATLVSDGMLFSFAVASRYTGIQKWFIKGRDFFRSTIKVLMIWIHKPASILLALLWTYGHQAAVFTIVWLLFQGMGENITWWMVAGLWIFNYFITTLPISINGLGVQELSIAYIYTQFGGVSTDSGLVMAVIIRVLYMFASLPGVIALPEIFESRLVKASQEANEL